MEKNKNLQLGRHGLAHVLAYAVKQLYPTAKLGIGPAIENGFYYDFDIEESITEDKFVAIEKKMNEILREQKDFVRKEVSYDEAIAMFANEPYKLELINDLKGQMITVYYIGDEFFDLCAGPHVQNSKLLMNYAFKINVVNGAYWKGSESNNMLQRVYVYAFDNRADLKSYINNIEEAKKRDHNKLGRELELFTTSAVIGQGLPILLPKGAKITQILQRFVEDEEESRGYLLTKTPLLAKSDLYKISGHWQHYKDGMFVLGDETKDAEVFALRPMTCPFQFQAYLTKQRSYKELPFRYGETSTLFRNEQSGEMHGLIRVRQFTISEGHIVCTPEQMADEFKNSLDLAKYMLSTLGFINDVKFRFSKWDENNKDKYIGEKEQWEDVQNKMRNILNNLQLEYDEADGDAAFYGPKLDIQMKNVWGKEDTIITIQLDFALAEKFGMEYIDSDGQKKYPVIIHRTSIGCYERTLALLIEKFAGKFPFWISPEQVGIVPVLPQHIEYANNIAAVLKQNKLRVRVDEGDDNMGTKIKGFRKELLPYVIIVGDKEQSENTISLRTRNGVQINNIELDKFIAVCNKMNNEHLLDLIDEF